MPKTRPLDSGSRSQAGIGVRGGSTMSWAVAGNAPRPTSWWLCRAPFTRSVIVRTGRNSVTPALWRCGAVQLRGAMSPCRAAIAHLWALVVDSRCTDCGPGLPSGSNSAGRVSASQAERPPAPRSPPPHPGAWTALAPTPMASMGHRAVCSRSQQLDHPWTWRITARFESSDSRLSTIPGCRLSLARTPPRSVTRVPLALG
jgi:hypothetical protein